MNFMPHHGAPNFRYTGSDPSQAVWNFGWPIASVIYDSQNGLHFGPIILLVIPLQIVGLLLLLASLAVICIVRQSRKNSAEQAAPSNR
jgi:hypothetical protein